MPYRDHGEIERMAPELAESGYGLRDLVATDVLPRLSSHSNATQPCQDQAIYPLIPRIPNLILTTNQNKVTNPLAMCDEHTERDIDKFLGQGGQLSRRAFAKISAAAGFSALLPSLANAAEVRESEVTVETPDGLADAYFVYPSKGKHPAVLIWPDILGLRPAFRAMGKRLAESGYAVLVVNPYYRSSKAPVVALGASFRDPETREIVMPFYRELSAKTHTSDAKAFIAFLDQQKQVDTKRKIGTAGYCMGGPIIMRTAAAVPERVGAAASFHGGGLVTDNEDSPHLLIPHTQAHVLHAIAENDDEKSPETKGILRDAYASANIPAEIEVYKGTLHGWCPLDSAVYNEPQAEKAWARLLSLYERALV